MPRLSLDLNIDETTGGKYVEVILSCGEMREMIYVDYPNPNYKHGGSEAAAFGLVAAAFRHALEADRA